jgi:hypothetical protein
VYVFNSAVGVTSPFCVGSTEAKLASGLLVHEAAGTPLITSYQDAVARCNGIPKGSFTGNFGLITNAEWNTVAHTIAYMTSNWTGGAIGAAGVLYSGHTYAVTSTMASIDEANPCNSPTNSGCSDAKRRRYHNLSYGQKIWDFSGNAIEYVKDTDMIFYNTPNATVELMKYNNPALTVLTNYAPSSPSCSAMTSPYCGLGSLLFYCSERSNGTTAGGCDTSGTQLGSIALPVVFRGGSSINGAAAGIYAATRFGVTNATYDDSGFRCVYHP